MKEGDVALASLPQADGQVKTRPVIVLRAMPPFGDWLVCGVSTQTHLRVAGLDESVETSHADFRNSGLKAASLIRLGFLSVLPASQLLGVLGSIAPERHKRLLNNLCRHLTPT
jgi:mRNA interferase MazF